MCRGRVTEVDEDHHGNTLWRVRYEADGEEEDYDKQQMEQYVINRTDGTSEPDGGMSARLRAEAADHEICVPPAPAPAVVDSGDTGVDEHDKVPSTSSPESGGGAAPKAYRTSTTGKDFDAYVTQSDDTWATILKHTGVTVRQQRAFLRWLQKYFNIGSSKECKAAEKLNSGTWFKSPIGGKQTRSRWSVPEGTIIPIPSGPEWDTIIQSHIDKEKSLRTEHLSNQAAAAAAYAEVAHASTGKRYYTPEKFEFQLVPNDQQTTDWLYYVDKVEESLEPGRDPKKTKYIDPTSGLPIAPKSYKDLLSRGNDPSVQMWLKAGEEEWAGLVGRDCFIHDVSRTWLIKKGILECEENPKGKQLINMRMLFDVKRDGRCKCRAVVSGHQRAIRRNIDYQTSDVYAPAPRLETGRALQAFACMYNLYRDAADCVQAYLIGTPSPDQHYPTTLYDTLRGLFVTGTVTRQPNKSDMLLLLATYTVSLSLVAPGQMNATAFYLWNYPSRNPVGWSRLQHMIHACTSYVHQMARPKVPWRPNRL